MVAKSRYFDNSQLAEAIRIANGQTKGVSHINKFGFNDAINNNFETIWDGGGIYDYIDSVGASSTLTVTAADQNDSGYAVEIEGLDANYQPLTETIIATEDGNTGTSQFYRVFRATITSDGDSANVGNINITGDSKTLARISAEKGQTLMALYTVPADKKGYLLQFQGSVEKNKETIFKFMAKESNDRPFNTKGQFGSFGVPVTYDYSIPLEFPEKTDLEVRAKAGAVTGAGAIFDLILIDD